MSKSFGGRPRLPREEKRDRRIVTFLTGEERSMLERFARNADLSISRACHDLLVMGMDQMASLQTGKEKGSEK
jgi:hypothetical protein